MSSFASFLSDTIGRLSGSGERSNSRPPGTPRHAADPPDDPSGDVGGIEEGFGRITTPARNDRQEPGVDDVNRVASLKAPALPPPSRLLSPLRKNKEDSTNAGFHRARSLSRVFNQVPTDRPTVAQAQVDLIEYYCHLVCLQTQPARVRQEGRHLMQALQQQHEDLPRYGRLWSRLQIACLSISMGSLVVDDDDEGDEDAVMENNDEDALLPPLLSAAEVSSEMWNELLQQLETVQNYLVRQDANVDASVAPADRRFDAELQQHSMFQADYQPILLLLRVQAAACRFREQLQVVVRGSDDKPKGDEDTTRTIATIVEEYETSLKAIFARNTSTADSEGQDKQQNPSVIVPQQLTSFLSTFDRPTAAAKQMLKDSLAVAQGRGGSSSSFAVATLQQKTRDLLLKWSESILSIPTLVRLGYGGVRAPIVAQDDEAHDNDDVSSYGMGEDEQQLDTQEQQQQAADTPQTQGGVLFRLEDSNNSRGRRKRNRRGPNTSATSEERFPASRQRRRRERSVASDQEREEDEGEQRASESDEETKDRSAALPASPTGIRRRRPEKTPRRLSTPRSNAASQRSVEKDKPGGTSDTDQARRAVERRRKPEKEQQRTTVEEDRTNQPERIKEIGPAQRRGSSDRTQHRQASVARHPAQSYTRTSAVRSASSRKQMPSSSTDAAVAIDDASSDSSTSPKRSRNSATTRRIHGGTPRSSRKSATVAEKLWDTSSSSTTEEEHRLSSTTAQEAALWDTSSSAKKPRQKIGWTAEESEAVREGYLKYGPKWRMIKDNCDNKLCRRTNVQIKDRFRTMKSRGEIQEGD